MHRPASALFLLLLAALALPASAAAYPWPFRPFDVQHPIRGFFGDPRTVFREPVEADGIDGPGAFSFHQGVDISAPDGTPVYSVSDGTAHYLGAHVVNVVGTFGVTFQYFHLTPVVGEGEHVRQSRTVLGYVQPPYGHVHLTEIDGIRAVNPLLPGHLSPYRDATTPAIEAVSFLDALGPVTPADGICGRVEIEAQASDPPPLPVPGAFHGFPVAPALVAWSVVHADGRAAVPRRVAADFVHMLPPNRRFWDVYARGTYENVPRFGPFQYAGTPGRYLFRLAASFDTGRLRNGGYVLVVRVADVRGHAAVARQPFTVLNDGACADSLPPDPLPGTPPAPPPLLLKPPTPTPGSGAEEPPPPRR